MNRRFEAIPTDWDHVLQQTIMGSALPPKAIADGIGVPIDYLRSAANPDKPSHQFQARLLLPLMDVTNNDEPLRFLAAKRGYALMRLPDAHATDEALYEHVSRVVEEVGQGVTKLREALADEHITDAEAFGVVREFRESVEQIAALEAAVLARAETPAPARMAMPVRRQAVSA